MGLCSPSLGSGQPPDAPAQLIDGFAVPVTAKSLSRGVFRLSRATAQQFFGRDTVVGATTNGQQPAPSAFRFVAISINNGSAAYEALSLLLSRAERAKPKRQQPKGVEQKSFCELSGLRAWLAVQGATAGTHWVQLWRAAAPNGQQLMLLQLCEEQPTCVPDTPAQQLAAAAETAAAAAATAAAHTEPDGDALQTAASATAGVMPPPTQRAAPPAEPQPSATDLPISSSAGGQQHGASRTVAPAEAAAAALHEAAADTGSARNRTTSSSPPGGKGPAVVSACAVVRYGSS